jgi:hypothetical protein
VDVLLCLDDLEVQAVIVLNARQVKRAESFFLYGATRTSSMSFTFCFRSLYLAMYLVSSKWGAIGADFVRGGGCFEGPGRGLLGW